MNALRIISTTTIPAPNSLIRTNYLSSPSSFPPKKPIRSPLLRSTHYPKSNFTKLNNTANSPSLSAVSTEPEEETAETFDQDEKFDWFSHWYAIMPVCDLDKRVPVGKKVLGLDVVVWWDKNESAWKVFDDKCPHRLAPLSEGRIDQWGRLQCVYHGWCFGGSGHCKFIPQAPHDGPPVHSFPKACVGVYPSTVQNGIVWFWPNTDPKYKDIITEKRPPCVPELDDPSFAHASNIYTRDMPYGYEVLVENLIDPSHVPYAHHGIFRIAPMPRLDREGGSPIDIVNITRINKNGFTSAELPDRKWKFVPPCLVLGTGTTTIRESPDDIKEMLTQKPPRKSLFVFFCIPVSPGKSRLISAGPRNFSLWMDRFEQRWMHHMLVNLIIDSDLYFLRVQEEKLKEVDPLHWQNTCFVPTKADVMVVAYRKWLKKYAGGQIDWGTKFKGHVSSIPHRELLMDRYRSHVLNCSSCNGAYKGLNAFQISLQVFSVALVAVMAATEHSRMARIALMVLAILCFVGSKLLSRYIYKYFHFHDYNHAFK